GDIDALVALEHRVFDTDRLSRHSLQRFQQSSSAEVIVAQAGAALAGTAIVLFRARSLLARLYSIAVAPEMSGRGVASMLLQAARGAGVRRRLPRHPPRSACDQPRCDRTLWQERLSAIWPAAEILRGRRRRAAVRETARREAASP